MKINPFKSFFTLLASIPFSRNNVSSIVFYYYVCIFFNIPNLFGQPSKQIFPQPNPGKQTKHYRNLYYKNWTYVDVLAFLVSPIRYDWFTQKFSGFLISLIKPIRALIRIRKITIFQKNYTFDTLRKKKLLRNYLSTFLGGNFDFNLLFVSTVDKIGLPSLTIQPEFSSKIKVASSNNACLQHFK